jgi:hypothetical protein
MTLSRISEKTTTRIHLAELLVERSLFWFYPSTMNFQTEVLQSEFLAVIILRTLHHLLQNELEEFFNTLCRPVPINRISMVPHCHRLLKWRMELISILQFY